MGAGQCEADLADAREKRDQCQQNNRQRCVTA